MSLRVITPSHALVSFATTSIGNTVLDSLGRHLFRYLLLLTAVAVVGAAMERSRERSGQPPATLAERIARFRRWIRIRFAISGFVLGATWVWHSSEPAWLHAIRVLVLVVIVGPLVRIALRSSRLGRARHRPASTIITMSAARGLLVLVALGIQWILERSLTVTDATVVTALGLTVAVTLGGPELTFALARRRRSRSAASDAELPEDG
jgi:hypothetical protein